MSDPAPAASRVGPLLAMLPLSAQRVLMIGDQAAALADRYRRFAPMAGIVVSEAAPPADPATFDLIVLDAEGDLPTLAGMLDAAGVMVIVAGSDTHWRALRDGTPGAGLAAITAERARLAARTG